MEKHAQQEINYRLSKWLIWNAGIEQILTPDEVENIFRELLSFYDPPAKCVERVQSITLHFKDGGTKAFRYIQPKQIHRKRKEET